MATPGPLLNLCRRPPEVPGGADRRRRRGRSPSRSRSSKGPRCSHFPIGESGRRDRPVTGGLRGRPAHNMRPIVRPHQRPAAPQSAVRGHLRGWLGGCGAAWEPSLRLWIDRWRVEVRSHAAAERSGHGETGSEGGGLCSGRRGVLGSAELSGMGTGKRRAGRTTPRGRCLAHLRLVAGSPCVGLVNRRWWVFPAGGWRCQRRWCLPVADPGRTVRCQLTRLRGLRIRRLLVCRPA